MKRLWLPIVCALLGCGGAEAGDPSDAHDASRVVEDAGADERGTGGLACEGVPVPTDRPPDGTPLPSDVARALEALEPSLASALGAGDVARVESVVCEARAILGSFQGVAEASASYVEVPSDEPDAARALALFVEEVRRSVLGREPWASGSTHGQDASAPLRGACSLVQWELAASAVSAPEDRDALRASARAGLDWLLAIQAPSGLFPYPDLGDEWEALLAACGAEGLDERACFERAPRAVQLSVMGTRAWEAAGRPEGVLVDGWFVDSPGDPGGLQFDTGICGHAMVDGASALGDPRYLESARAAARWALGTTPVGNWNYNAFTVELAVWLGEVDPTEPWRDRALARARLGVLPGLMPDGRFFDPHNARVVYHAILLRAVTALAATGDEPDVEGALAIMSDRFAGEIDASGAVAIDDGIAALLTAERAGRAEPMALHRLVQAGLRGGRVSSGGISIWAAARLAER